MDKEQLIEIIEQKRIELIQTVAIHGLNSPKTISKSKELDQLLNTYDRQFLLIETK